MNSLVAVYETHDNALNAIRELIGSGFNQKEVSLLSKAELVNNHIHVQTNQSPEVAEVSIGVTAGAVIGVLTGVGIFAIPGLGFLYGAGALIGAIAGFDLGLIGGGVVAIFTSLGVEGINAVKYEKHLNEGKFLVFVQGESDKVSKAQSILHANKLHLELASY